MILRRGFTEIFKESPLASLKELYFEKILTKSPFIPGDVYQLHQLRATAH